MIHFVPDLPPVSWNPPRYSFPIYLIYLGFIVWKSLNYLEGRLRILFFIFPHCPVCKSKEYSKCASSLLKKPLIYISLFFLLFLYLWSLLRHALPLLFFINIIPLVFTPEISNIPYIPPQVPKPPSLFCWEGPSQVPPPLLVLFHDLWIFSSKLSQSCFL